MKMNSTQSIIVLVIEVCLLCRINPHCNLHKKISRIERKEEEKNVLLRAFYLERKSTSIFLKGWNYSKII